MKQLAFSLLLFFSLNSYCQYAGTASVTQGLATTTTSNLYTCTNGRIAGVGTIVASDNSVWVVPAVVNYLNSTFPLASDLNNVCNGANFANSAAALSALNGSDIITIDPNGELITAFIFADNYFEMYINGIPVGKDNVPYTQFNSNIVRFRVNKPFTIAMLLVDWEEHLGLGSEVSNGFQYHDGDGGMVAVFKDSTNAIIAKTGSDWKAQTFYTSPITDLTCPTENGSLRLSNNCSTADVNNGTSYYGLHWSRPGNWTEPTFNDSLWPAATLYSNATIGVNNKPAYTNFTNIFDDASNDAQFIWSTNVILDNEVIVRHTVDITTSIEENKTGSNSIDLFPNPAGNSFQLLFSNTDQQLSLKHISIYNIYGKLVMEKESYLDRLNFDLLPSGNYLVKILINNQTISKRLVIE